MTRSPSKLVRSAILTAFAGLISVGISPGTLAIVFSGISSSFGELVGLSGVLTVTPAPQPAVNISAPGDIASAGSVSFSGLLSEGLLLVHAASDVDGLPGIRSASADATVNGLSANLSSLTGASFISFSAVSVGSTASVKGDFGALTRSGATSLVGASLSVAGKPFIIDSSPAPNTVVVCTDPQEDPGAEALPPSDLCGLKVTLNEQILSGDGVESGGITVNAIHVQFDDFPLGNAGVIDGEIVISNSQATLRAIQVQSDETQATLTPTQEVPAPATLLLLLAGVPGLLLLRRRGRPIDGSTGLK